MSCLTFGAISGITWTAEAPVPMIATRLPVKSTVWSQRAVCRVMPAKESTPSISGNFGMVSTPLALTRNRAVSASPESRSRPPQVLGVIEHRTGDGGVELDPGPQTVLVDAAVGVGAQLFSGA